MSAHPPLSEIVAEFDGPLARMKDLRAVMPAVERLLQAMKERDFRLGRGPQGSHRPLKPATRRRHRTGVPLHNTGRLKRSYTHKGSAGYHFQARSRGFEYGSRLALVAQLEQKGYRLTGLRPDQWAKIERLVDHWIWTGKILSIRA